MQDKRKFYVKQFHFCVKWREGREEMRGMVKEKTKRNKWVHEANHKSLRCFRPGSGGQDSGLILF